MEGKILKAAAAQATGPVLKQQVLSASEQAQRILAEASAERERVRAEAFEAGFRAGLAQWETAIAAAQRSVHAFIEESRPSLLKLAVRIAEKILGEEVRTAPERLEGIVEEALRTVVRERRVTVYVAPGHRATLEAARARFEKRLGPDCSLRLDEADDLAPGDCRIVSELGSIDARIETQLRLIERALLEEASR
ncbi:MAG TPA: HrpE/YscL family type III secretion apparatus protein [Solibacterales bacterium]|nr:HrpE/YscL family type III secretion apparatus protein [Bryobacterales bacterium]